MSGFIEGENRYQTTLFPERVYDYVDEDSAARVIDVFVDRLDISGSRLGPAARWITPEIPPPAISVG
jgi:hypothetical protein